MTGDSINVGGFGKTPAFSDFVCFGMGHRLVERLDNWARGALMTLGRAYATDWARTYDALPSLRFVIADSSNSWLYGSLIPSHDRTGRRYPFFLCGVITHSGAVRIHQIPLEHGDFGRKALEFAQTGLRSADARDLQSAIVRTGESPDDRAFLSDESLEVFASSFGLSEFAALVRMGHPGFDCDKAAADLRVVAERLAAPADGPLGLILRLPLPDWSDGLSWPGGSATGDSSPTDDPAQAREILAVSSWLKGIEGLSETGHPTCAFWHPRNETLPPTLYVLFRWPPPILLVHLMYPHHPGDSLFPIGLGDPQAASEPGQTPSPTAFATLGEFLSHCR
jgi:type VI secretion system ImpM family protein